MVANSPNSPRQKMINLMYLVFIAMLALNVSADVLRGFDIIGDTLERSTEKMQAKNDSILKQLENYNSHNREKAGEWYGKAIQVKRMSDSLVNHIDELKQQIVRESDGKRGDVGNIRNKENWDATATVMLSSSTRQGERLRAAIESYRRVVAALIQDPGSRTLIENSLSTELSTHERFSGSWEESLFREMPVSAAVTILSKIQNDIRLSESEALRSLLDAIDGNDLRVNQLQAYVIPESKVLFQGDTYKARIILSAADSTRRHNVVVNGKPLDPSANGLFTVGSTSVGTFPVEGYIEMAGGDGNVVRKAFSESYTVIEPMATIAPTLMNVLYAGIPNEISISAPGIAPQDISASMTNGSLVRKGGVWEATPAAAGRDATITITARRGGEVRQLASRNFRIRPLPDPTPYIEYVDANGNRVIFKGGSLTKSQLMNATGISAAIDDGILNIPFRVISFRTLFFDAMGNAIPEISDGSRFSERQKEQIRRLQRGRYFYISGVKAVGPDGLEREIAVIEVKVN